MTADERPIFLSAEWRHLLLMNFEVDPAILASRLPAGTELDLFGGKCYVSLVGFMFLHTRLAGRIPIPFHTNFEEINLRFYVKRTVNGEQRRGVCFVKEIVPRMAVALVARVLYGENYVSRPMSHLLDLENSALRLKGRVVYSWLEGVRKNHIAAACNGKPFYPDAGSEPHFIIEHYYGYAKDRKGQTVEYRVEHPEWRIMHAADARVDVDVENVYGTEFVPYLSKPPASVFVAEGSPIVVRKGVQIEPAQK